jgi:hypothetical protein
VEETKVESLRKDKAATEKALQEAVERGQAELATQKEFYSNALIEAREAAALAEARVDNEARADLDRRLKEASEREISLVQNIDELRQALIRVEQQVHFLLYCVICVLIRSLDIRLIVIKLIRVRLDSCDIPYSACMYLVL